MFVLSVPFEERGVATANGARWDAGSRQTVFVGRSLPFGLTPYASADYSWERWIEDDRNGSVAPVTRAVARMKPRPHQIEAAKRIAKAAHAGYRGFVEADDVGLGKTIATWCGVLLLPKVRPVRNVLIMCPKGVVPHWRSTIAAVGDGGLRITVVNYDRAKSLLSVPESATTAKRTRTKNKQIATKGTSLVDWDVVIFDESHKIKNQGSQRSQAAARLARYAAVAQVAPFVVWMSATIGQNPVELGYLTPLLAQLTGATKTALADFGQWLADQGFHVEYQARFDQWVWCPVPADATSEQIAAVEAARRTDTQRIHALLFGSPDRPSIRRLPTDIAGWPEIQRILHPVTLDRAGRGLYEQAWTEFRSAMSLAQRGRDPKGALAARTRFRQKASLIRADDTIEQTLDLIDNGHQVAISCEWLETIDEIRAGLEKHGVKVAEFTGRTTTFREQERLAFQRGQRTVMLFNVCEGISLHAREDLKDGTFATAAPRTTIVHDPRYSGLDSLQIEGRCHRDGQYAAVRYSYAADTVEYDIVRTVLGRVTSTKEMQGDEVGLLRQLESILLGGSDAGVAGGSPAGVEATPVHRGTAPAASAGLRDALAGGAGSLPVARRDGATERTALRNDLRSR